MRAKELKRLKRPALSGAEREARRRSGRTPEQVDKERANSRVGMAAHRAGGLAESRARDVRAGKRKYQGSSVYSGDALRNSEILEGSFIVNQLKCTHPNCIPARRSSLGPPPGGRHRT